MKPVSAFENFPPFASAGSRTAPGDAKYATGFVPADTFPAEWSNYLFYKSSKCATDLNSAVRSLWLELASILTDYNITADASSTDQILTALKKIYPQVTTCATSGSTQNKALAISGGVLKTGNIYSITMTHGNTYGDGDSTYPTMSLNSGTAYPMCDAGGNYLASGAWEDGEVINVLFNGSKFLMATRSPVDKIENNNMRPVTSNAVSVIAATSTTITGPKIGIGATVKIMFTADIAGSDTATALSINYNGISYPVKVGKQGALSEIKAHEVSTGVYKYLQAYTTLELIFDGTNFIVLGNPVVLSSDDYIIYSDGYYKWLKFGATERWTGEFWTDGKPIYIIIIEQSISVNAQSMSTILTASQTSAMDLDCLIKVSAFIPNSVLVYFDLIRLNSDGSYSARTSQVSTGTRLWIFEYTKTNDSAGTIPPFSN